MKSRQKMTLCWHSLLCFVIEWVCLFCIRTEPLQLWSVSEQLPFWLSSSWDSPEATWVSSALLRSSFVRPRPFSSLPLGSPRTTGACIVWPHPNVISIILLPVSSMSLLNYVRPPEDVSKSNPFQEDFTFLVKNPFKWSGLCSHQWHCLSKANMEGLHRVIFFLPLFYLAWWTVWRSKRNSSFFSFIYSIYYICSIVVFV